MNPQELQQKIAEYYAKLPKEAQDIFSSMQWLDTLKSLSAKHNLNTEQIETLGTETTLVLLGIIHVEEYEEIINKEIKIQRNSLDELLADINDEILKPIRSKLTEAFIKNSTELTKEDEEDLLEDQPINSRFSTLTKETQEAIKNTNYQTKLFNISRDNGLSIDKMDALENLTVDIILNKIHPEDFTSVLKDTLRIDDTKSNEIVKQINEQILKEIRKNLISATEKEKVVEKSETETLLEIKKEGEINKNNQAKMNDFKPRTEQPMTMSKSTEIEIMPEELPKPEEATIQKPTEIIQKPISSMSAQKFSNSFKTGIRKTDYSISNDLKKFTVSNTDTKSATPIPTPPKPAIPKIDPYREIPE